MLIGWFSFHLKPYERMEKQSLNEEMHLQEYDFYCVLFLVNYENWLAY